MYVVIITREETLCGSSLINMNFLYFSVWVLPTLSCRSTLLGFVRVFTITKSILEQSWIWQCFDVHSSVARWITSNTSVWPFLLEEECKKCLMIMFAHIHGLINGVMVTCFQRAKPTHGLLACVWHTPCQQQKTAGEEKGSKLKKMEEQDREREREPHSYKLTG